ncbi:DUF4238 domain-containing protein [Paenibacillus polymyxa]|uniref:DUF4238 domain-containing protein n=1 Tax=Paenibacillus polymyxa TaxID=1406 RepID=UPI000F8967C0|nr:DUF4238 domain-containing protein [Paenibacillus polymyxa]RTZ37892.1 DUF4238 domain-containing protein [Paenibacillus polymyxa]
MAEKKNQHFVPRFYLKYFSCEGSGKYLGIYNIPNNKKIARGGLQGQASKDYFYGKDLEIEDALGKIELEASKIFNAMIITGEVPMHESVAHYILYVFIFSLSARTEQAGDSVNEMADKMAKEVLKHNREIKKYLEGISFGYDHPTLLSISAAMQTLPLIEDLKFKFLFNGTDIPFITSDHPVIKYNQFCEKRKKFGGHTGLATKGFQIFFPMFPDLYIVLYDSDVYRLGNKKDEVINIVSKKDVQSLNLLQFINAHRNIYFNEGFKNEYLEDLKKRGSKFRKKFLSSVVEYKRADGLRHESLLHMYSNDTKIGLNLSFIKEVKKAKKYDLGSKVVHYRDKSKVESFESEIKSKNFNKISLIRGD